MNPLKREVVTHPKEWPSSRVSFYSKSKQNFIRVDRSAELRITEGKTNPEISTILDTTLHTIKKHNNRLFAKLGVETRMAAARLAMSVLTAPAQ